MTNGKPVLLTAWEALDHIMDEIMRIGAEDPAATLYKNEARGMAKLLAACGWFAPHYITADDIAREALARWKGRQPNAEPRHTLGTVVALAGHDIKVSMGIAPSTPASPRIGSSASPSPSTPAPAVPAKASKVFTEKEISSINFALNSGFNPAMLCGTYQCTLADIESIRAA